MKVNLSGYDNRWYSPGASAFKRMLWYVIGHLFVSSHWLPLSGVKVFVLRAFGATIGKAVVIKPGVNIKYPWFLSVGDNCWLGENVWVDNLVAVRLGNSVCISQGALLLTGNHNYKKPGFDLMVAEINIEDAVWIGAKALVCPGVHCKTHAVLTAQSVATSDLEAFGIYQGNPAQLVKTRVVD